MTDGFRVQVDLVNYFRDGLIGRKIPHFPYAERFCPFCERQLTLVEAIHVQEAPENYKALFICFNPDCGAYDEAARKAYARVYYSSELAFKGLQASRIITTGHPVKK